jgi:hypothetical protein
LAHEAGALAWIDAVHYAAHEPIDVREVGAASSKPCTLSAASAAAMMLRLAIARADRGRGARG